MARSYKSGRETQSAIIATTNSVSVDLRGYSELAVSTIFGTCSGTTNTGSLVIQTSNDNVNWHTIVTIWSHADVVDASTDTYFDFLPDATATALAGFGRYIRFRFIGTGTYAATYTIYWEARG